VKTFMERGSLRKNPDSEDLKLVAVVGPTGGGKSELALRLAEEFQGEVVNCDSVQIYRLFDVGAAKLPEEKRRGVPHHLIDIADPAEVFTAGDFARVGRPVLRNIAERGHLPIVTGGTGFYLRALLDGLAPGPQRDAELRVGLRARESSRPGSLHRILSRLDPRTAARIHRNDTPKVMRALEICISSRGTATELFSAGRDALEGFRVLKIGVFPDRDELYKRLAERTEAMFDEGIIEETQAILARGYSSDCKPFESIGYKQALQTIRGELSPKDARFYAARETRRYSKRQMTWFRQDRGIEIFRGFGDDPQVTEMALARVHAFVNDKQSC
jgi:tRNA dimethylallyltransferase